MNIDCKGLVAIAVLVPVFIIGLIIFLYRRKHGYYPSLGRKRVMNDPPSTNPATRRPRRRGVWRPGDPEEGLPGYTTQASDGELSLGVGRKRGEDEEYELSEATDRSISGDTRESRPGSTVMTTTTGGATGLITPPTTKPDEELPPYIPPPAPAILVTDGYLFGRAGSRLSVGSGPRRTSYPSSSRRSSRVE